MKQRRTGKIAISLILILLGLIFLIYGISRQIEPNIDEVSRLKAEGIINQIISETIGEAFVGDKVGTELFFVQTDEDGKVQMVQANTTLINEKIATLMVSLQSKYESLEPEELIIPIGTLFGSPLLSRSEKGLKIRVLPLSVSKCDFYTAFEGQGINQTKYKIYVEIESNVRVLQPFSQENFDIKTNMLVSEIVIVGDVPESYIQVPEEDILDVN